MHGNRPQFAVVREDPETLRAVVERTPRRRILLVGSGGCSALCARSWWPRAEISLVEPNPAQRKRVQEKVDALRQGPQLDGRLDAATLRRFNVGDQDASGLSQDGNFEGLFRGLRAFIEEFVASPETIRGWFEPGSGDRAPATMRRAIDDPYWPVAFELFFHDSLLETMFGPAATQHAEPGSYPKYFRERIERGLVRSDRADNYFLHHLFLGCYLDRPNALPPFLRQAPSLETEFDWFDGELAAIESFAGYDVVDLSNVLDWTDEVAARDLARRIGAELDPGASVMWRQLNNRRQRESWFGDYVVFDRALGQRLVDVDRSLFYESVHVGQRRNGSAQTS